MVGAAKTQGRICLIFPWAGAFYIFWIVFGGGNQQTRGENGN